MPPARRHARRFAVVKNFPHLGQDPGVSDELVHGLSNRVIERFWHGPRLRSNLIEKAFQVRQEQDSVERIGWGGFKAESIIEAACVLVGVSY